MDGKSLDFSFAHMGVNLADEAEAKKCVTLMSTLFGLAQNPANESSGASFTGTDIEWMKSTGYGTHGHIGIATSDLPAAKAYLEEQGVSFIAGSEKYFPDGRLLVIYADLEIGGFAVHLMQK